MIGQLSNEQFKSEFPNANINNGKGTAITIFGKNTINYWIQHEDNSWTNYDCKTDMYRHIF